MRTKSKAARGGFALLFAVLAITVFGFVVMQLWNALLPDLLKLPIINFWQAAGLLLLSRILFGGMGRGPRGPMGQHLRNRWKRMNPEERERFRSMWKEHGMEIDDPAVG